MWQRWCKNEWRRIQQNLGETQTQSKWWILLILLQLLKSEKNIFFFQYFMNIYSKPRSLKKYAKTLISDVTIFLPGAIEWTKEWIKKKWVTVKTSRREENMRRNISKFCQILFMFSFTLSIYALSLSSHTFSNEKIIYLNASGKFNICIYLVLLEFLENIV